MQVFHRVQFWDLLFLVYMNDLPNSLQSNPKFFANDTFLFSTVQDITTSTVSINHDLTKTSAWAVKWKMNFDPDPCKQAQELLFSQKINSKPHPSLNLNDNPVHQFQLQKHLRLFLDPKSSFDEHIQCIFNKTRKIIGNLVNLRPHLGYGDIIYNRAFNESFQNKSESVQYNAALAITGAIRSS